jgi:hypothetical protein
MAKSSRKMLAATVFVVVACGARAAPAIAATQDWIWPLEGPVITPYLNDNSRPYAAGMHRGIDIGVPVGTKVVAAHTGGVTYAGPLGSSGLTVAIATSDGAYVTSYLHLSRISLERGETVEAGDEVGAVGMTGTRSASEPHLHFGVHRADDPDSYVDPQSLLPLPTPQTRAVPPASVPARDEVRAGPAPATLPPRLTVPLGLHLHRRAGVPANVLEPVRLPKAFPVPAHAGAAVETAAHAPSPARAAQQSGFRARPKFEPASKHARSGGYAPRERRLPSSAAQAARDPAASGWGRLLAIAGLAIFGAAIAGRRLLGLRQKVRVLARVRRQGSQPRPRPPAPSRDSLAGLSQVS